MDTKIPDCIKQYLMVIKQKDDLKEQQKKLKVQLNTLENKVHSWLQQTPNYECHFDFQNARDVQMFGNTGKLKYRLCKPREYLGLHNLTLYLQTFFSQLHPDRNDNDVMDLAQQCAQHVWRSREVKKTKPKIIRTYVGLKRKKHE